MKDNVLYVAAIILISTAALLAVGVACEEWRFRSYAKKCAAGICPEGEHPELEAYTYQCVCRVGRLAIKP